MLLLLDFEQHDVSVVGSWPRDLESCCEATKDIIVTPRRRPPLRESKLLQTLLILGPSSVAKSPKAST